MIGEMAARALDVDLLAREQPPEALARLVVPRPLPQAWRGLRRRELGLGGRFVTTLERVGLAWGVVRSAIAARLVTWWATPVAAGRGSRGAPLGANGEEVARGRPRLALRLRAPRRPVCRDRRGWRGHYMALIGAGAR